MNIQFESKLTWAALLVVLGATGAFLWQWSQSPAETPRASVEAFIFLMLVLMLLWGSVVYLLARTGYLRRRSESFASDRAVLEAVYDRAAPRLAILIPSYREDRRVLLQTILSVALMEYPGRRIVLLIDDPPTSIGSELDSVQACRNLVSELNEQFAARACSFQANYESFVLRSATRFDAATELDYLGSIYTELACWSEDFARTIHADTTAATAHVDNFFVERVLKRVAAENRQRVRSLVSADAGCIGHEYRRIAAMLNVEISSFERKRYVNLSHRPNKAMNLNAYIGLIGGRYCEVVKKDGVHLVCASSGTIDIPSVDYLLTIDADSVVLPNYALQLLHIMEDDDRIAVAQTPYSAFPEAPARLERTAGATTDLQYIIHQGFTAFRATYWVGANALLRVAALRDVQQVADERGFQVPVFIQDRTVIEDTGSTIDLIRKGWTLYNYPARLAYSATPPDFGALVIQRTRWSNGGLIIAPDLIRHLWATYRSLPISEALMRAYYLLSPSVANVALLAVLLYRFDDRFVSVWLIVAAAPYYLMYGRDLRLAGYSWYTLLQVYALNLLLLPVNLAGVLLSVRQIITGRKTSFRRTPKIQYRTPTPAVHIAFNYAMLAYLSATVVEDVAQGSYGHAGFALVNVVFYYFGIAYFLGWRDSLGDLWHGLGKLVRSPRPVVEAVAPFT